MFDKLQGRQQMERRHISKFYAVLRGPRPLTGFSTSVPASVDPLCSSWCHTLAGASIASLWPQIFAALMRAPIFCSCTAKRAVKRAARRMPLTRHRMYAPMPVDGQPVGGQWAHQNILNAFFHDAADLHSLLTSREGWGCSARLASCVLLTFLMRMLSTACASRSSIT